jgi:hypothetical protein
MRPTPRTSQNTTANSGRNRTVTATAADGSSVVTCAKGEGVTVSVRVFGFAKAFFWARLEV